jgi:hypothetical protein
MLSLLVAMCPTPLQLDRRYEEHARLAAFQRETSGKYVQALIV